MIFDSVYDTYRGVVTYVRVVDGRLSRRERTLMMSTAAAHETLEVGVISPEPTPSEGLAAGEVGYLITGVKDVRQARVGDTVTSAAHPAAEISERPRPTKYQTVPSVQVASTAAAAKRPARNPTFAFTIWNASSAPMSRHAASQ